MLFLQQNSHWLNRFQNATSEKKVPHIVQDGQENLYKNAVENDLRLCNSMKFRLDTTFCKFNLEKVQNQHYN